MPRCRDVKKSEQLYDDSEAPGEDFVKQLLVFAVACVFLAPVVFAGSSSDDTIATGQGSLTFHPVEHATFVMKWNGTTIAVDPIGGEGPYKAFGKADLILITHPASVAEKFPEVDRGRITVVANGESVNWGESIIEAIPMYNLAPDRKDFHPKGRGNGYVVTLGGTRIYIAGDTEDIPEMRALEDIDAAFVCMNLPYTMDVAAAADAVLEFKPQVVFPYHYRGKGGMSDLDRFSALVAANPNIEVRLLQWY
ncbi:MAG: MBL fold metallo-hydrolase [Acidobacteria bacterium]|nr:MBL fold metallo-hydrolase [Candidatus Sulfomarinibacter kjeldsenii]